MEEKEKIIQISTITEKKYSQTGFYSGDEYVIYGLSNHGQVFKYNKYEDKWKKEIRSLEIQGNE